MLLSLTSMWCNQVPLSLSHYASLTVPLIKYLTGLCPEILDGNLRHFASFGTILFFKLSFSCDRIVFTWSIHLPIWNVTRWKKPLDFKSPKMHIYHQGSVMELGLRISQTECQINADGRFRTLCLVFTFQLFVHSFSDSFLKSFFIKQLAAQLKYCLVFS